MLWSLRRLVDRGDHRTARTLRPDYVPEPAPTLAADDLARLVSIEGTIATLSQRLEALETMGQDMPVVLDAISNMNSASRSIAKRAADVDVRVSWTADQVRRLWGQINQDDRTSAEPIVLNPGVIGATPLRLNLGCGHALLEGFVNIDRRGLPGVDVAAELFDLPFAPGTVDEVFSAHLLEHFSQDELRRLRMPYLTSLLKPGGTFRAVVVDGAAAMRAFTDGAMTFEQARGALFEGNEHVPDGHATMFSEASLSTLMQESGLVDAQVLAAGGHDGLGFELEVRARKPLSE